MNKSILLVFLATVGYCAAAYSHKYDYINVMDVLHTTRMLKKYVDCLLDVPRSCTQEGDYLKKILPDAIKTNCAECDAKQEDTAIRIIAFLMKHHSDWWQKIDTYYSASKSEFLETRKTKIEEYKNTL